MITRVDFKVPEIKNLKIAKDKSNIKDFYCADVHGGRSFLLNDGGYPMNDVDQILRAQDDKVRASLLAQLDEVPTSGVPSDTPNEEVLMSLRSRYQQTPSELVSFYERQLEIAESRSESAASSGQNIQLEHSDNTDVIDNV